MTSNDSWIFVGKTWPGNDAAGIMIRSMAEQLEAADAKLEEVWEIVLGLDYANDHARVQALTLLFGDDDE